MGVEQVTDLTTLSPQAVAALDASLTQLIQEFNPAIDLKSGVYHDQVEHLMAILQAADQQNINLVMQASSLAAITANPSLADNTVVNNLLSNYNIVRNPGVEATGQVTIVISQLVGTIIAQGTIFTINGLTFQTTAAYAGRTSSGAVVAPTDRLITAIGSNFGFTIPVTATAVGAIYNVPRASAATLSANPPFFVKAFAQSDFTGGLDAQTNAQLLSLLAQGLAIKAWSNRVSDEALIRKQFPNISNLSIIGFGDPEMIRDEHSIWPGHTGGRNDAYIRTQPPYQNFNLTVTATLISKIGPVGTWQYGVARNDAPGYYEVDRILLPSQDPTSAGFTPTSDTRNFDVSGVTNPPDIATTLEAVFSRYQTSVVVFVDTITDATSLTVGVSTQTYLSVMRMMPQIDAIQDYLLTRSIVPPQCDVLVKAPIPCFTTISCTVTYDSTKPAPTIAAIQTAVANAVNNLNFPGSLAASFVASTIASVVPNLISVTSILLSGTVLKPNLSTASLSSSTLITIPTDAANMTSPNTAVFFLQPASVSVTLVPSP